MLSQKSNFEKKQTKMSQYLAGQVLDESTQIISVLTSKEKDPMEQIMQNSRPSSRSYYLAERVQKNGHYLKIEGTAEIILDALHIVGDERKVKSSLIRNLKTASDGQLQLIKYLALSEIEKRFDEYTEFHQAVDYPKSQVAGCHIMDQRASTVIYSRVGHLTEWGYSKFCRDTRARWYKSMPAACLDRALLK